MKPALKAAAYCRVSTDREDQANSLTGQHKFFTDYITRHSGWQLVRVYYDEGISGTQTRNRTGFNAMIDAALHGEIDLILTKEVSRFARNTVDTLSYTRKLKEAGVGVIFTLDNIDTREPDGELRLSIMASIAQEESRKTSERVKWGQKRRMEQGVVFGCSLLGYTVDHGKLTINPREASVVRAVFHKYTNEGKGTHTIARELLEEGMPPKKADVWSAATLLKILKNEKYAGDLCQKKTFTPDYLTHNRKYNHGDEEMVCLKEHHEPIIDRALWERTQKELAARAVPETQKARHSNRYWCSQKVYCGKCGSRYVSRTRRLTDGTQYKAWRCGEAARHGSCKSSAAGKSCGCSNASVNDAVLLGCMQFLLSHIRLDYAAVKREIVKELRHLPPVPDTAAETSAIEKQISRLKEQRTRTLRLMLDGLITRDEMEELTSRYQEEKCCLDRRLLKTRQEFKIHALQSDSRPLPLAAVDDLFSPVPFCLLVCEEILDRITVNGNTLQIRLKGIEGCISFTFRTRGKKENFTTEILTMTFCQDTDLTR